MTDTPAPQAKNNQELDHSDMAKLFRKDPLEYTTDDITAMILTYRSTRHKFVAGNLTAGSTKAPTKAEKKRQADVKEVGELNLDDLMDGLI